MHLFLMYTDLPLGRLTNEWVAAINNESLHTLFLNLIIWFVKSVYGYLGDFHIPHVISIEVDNINLFF